MTVFEPVPAALPACHGKSEREITARIQHAIDAYLANGGTRRTVGGTRRTP